ncbi:MAG: UbiA family prenyltransferase [Rhizomicrobium sp.]
MADDAAIAQLVIYVRGSRVSNILLLPTILAIVAPYVIFAEPLRLSQTFGFGAAATGLAGLCVFVASLIFNDICDADADQIVHPERPLATGVCTPRIMAGWGFALYGAAALVAWLWSPVALLPVLLQLVFVLSHYGFFKKRATTAGSSEVLTSLQNAPIPIFGLAMALPAAGHPPTPLAWLLVALLTGVFYFADVASDVVSGILDQAGDSISGVATVAVGRGEKAAAGAAVAFWAACVACSVAFLYAAVSRVGLVLAVLAGIMATTFFVIRLIARTDTEVAVHRAYLSLSVFPVFFVLAAAATQLSEIGAP